MKQDLLKFSPVIVGVANDHGLQFIRLKQLKNFSTAHPVEACIEALEQRGHGCVENIVYICTDKFLPREGKKKFM